MLDMKQLKYFTVSADVSSFSKAAKILYTTQSNISKSIAAMEDSLGVKLFQRQARGIRLTAEGKNVYRYAVRILAEMKELENAGAHGSAEWLSISCTPSSWFSRRFVEYYNLHEAENPHCRIRTASVGEVLKRIHDYQDELGFVYVLNQRWDSFLYEIRRSHLTFEELSRTDAMLYLGQEHPLKNKEELTEEAVGRLHYIQMYQDVFTGEGQNWQLQYGDEPVLSDMDVSVITNSDYIMEMMLQSAKIANISGGYLTRKTEPHVRMGIPLKQKDNQVIYGLIQREGEELSEPAGNFAEYIRNAVKNG